MKFWVFLILPIILPSNAKSDDSALEMKLEALSTNIFARMAELETKNKQLEKRLAEVDPTREIFDCYRTENLDTDGIITFNGCSVDTTTGDPWTGSFTISEPGIYRLTFTGRGIHPTTTGDDVPYGYVFMKVDGEVVADAQNYYYPNQGTARK